MALKHALVTMGLMAASTTAFAETLTTKIDFPFQVRSTAFAASEYKVNVNSLTGGSVIMVTNPAAKMTRMYVSSPGTSAGYKAYYQPKLVFKCSADNACSLTEVHTTTGAQWLIPQPKLTPAEAERLTLVSVPARVTAD